MDVVDLGPGVGGVVVGEGMRGPPMSAPADPFDDSLMQLMHPLPVDGVDPMLDLIKPTLEGVMKLSGLPGMPCDEVLRQIFLDISRPPSSS